MAEAEAEARPETENDGGGSEFMKVVAPTTLIGVVVGVFYNIGYFSAIDLNLLALLSYKDQFETLLLILPTTIVPALLLLGFRRDRPQKSSWRTTTNRAAVVAAGAAIVGWTGRAEIKELPPIVSSLLALAVLLISLLLVAYFLAIIFEQLMAMTAGASEVRLEVLTVAVGGLLVFVLMLGNVKARLDASSGKFDTEVTFKSEGGKADKQMARLVRATDSGLFLILKDAPARLAFVRFEALTSFGEPISP